MFGTRQISAPARGRSILALSTLALLAFCCLPVLAQASSAGYEYQDAVPTPTGAPPSQSNLSGGSKPTSGGASDAHKSNTSNGGSAAVGKNSSANGGGGSGSGNGNAQQGSQGKADKGAPNTADATLANQTEPGSGGGGSSPLVPILIAIVLLAGGSIGYVWMKRRRRQKTPGSPDSPDSPDAAGSSGSSVSPEAS